MSHFIRVLRLIDGVCEELTGADEREVRDHLHPRVLKHLHNNYVHHDTLASRNRNTYFKQLV